MNLLRRLNSFDADVDFRKGWRVALVLSILMVGAGLISLGVRGLNLGIDFRGGTGWVFPANGTSTGTIQDALSGVGAKDATVQQLELDGDVTIRVEVGTDVDHDEAARAMAEASNQSVDVVNANRSDVGPSWGRDVSQKALRALIVFFLVIAGYISWRLEWRMAAGAIIAVLHDILVSVGVYSIFQFPVSPGTVIAFLTILGYSLYDTIVVYDKVHDNEGLVTLKGDMSYSDMMNLSVNQAFMRSINTTVATVIPVLSILVIGSVVMGATTLQEFGLALFVGLLVGAYSSLFIAAPAVVWFKNREPRNREINARLAARGVNGATTLEARATTASDTGDEGDAERVAANRPASGSTEVATRRPAPVTSPYSSKHPPRPRKQGKKR